MTQPSCCRAFVHGMQISSGIAAAVALALAVPTLIMLRSHDAAQAQDDPETGPHAPPVHVAHIAATPAGPPTR